MAAADPSTPSSSTSRCGRGRSTAARRSAVLPAADRDVLQCQPAVPRARRDAGQRRIARPRQAFASPRRLATSSIRPCTARSSRSVRAVAAARRLLRVDVRPDRRPVARHRHHGHRPRMDAAEFGIDVDHVDQYELAATCREGTGPRAVVSPAGARLTSRSTLGKIHWTAADATFRLTEELLRRQLAHVLRAPST